MAALIVLAAVLLLAAPGYAQVEISVNDVILMEGDSGTTNAVFTLTVQIPGFPEGEEPAPFDVIYSTGDGTATSMDGDYQPVVGGMISCDDSAGTCEDIVIAVNGDMKVEADQTFFVTITDGGGAIVIDPTGQATIQNDDQTDISINDPVVLEGDMGTTDTVFTVSLSNPSDFTVTASYATRDGSATTSTGDYQGNSGGVQFNPGITSQAVTILVNGDLVDEPDESFFVDLSNVANAGEADIEGQATVTNDDAATLSIDNVTVTEGDGGTVDVVFTVKLSNPSDTDVTVDFATRNGSATVADGDYQANSGQLLFNPGTTSLPVTVSVNGDDVVEPDESFFVDLTKPNNAGLTDSEGEGTISNDDATALSIDDVTVTEGDAGTVDAVFMVMLTNPSATDVTVDFATRNGSATVANGDYQVNSGQLLFSPGVTSQPVTVLVNGDLVAETDQGFFVDLTNPSGATISDGEGQGSITNDDGTALSIDDVSVTEGNGGTTNAVFTVRLTAPSEGPVAVSFATRDGTAATADGDYQAASGRLNFSPGATSRTLSVAVNGDATVEPDETFFVDLSNPSGAGIGDGEGEGTITNDDAPATLSINDVSVAEGDGGTTDAVFTVSLSAPTSTSVSVDFATASASANLADNDYQTRSGQLVFNPGVLSQNIAVPVVGDLAIEPDETFFVDLANPSGATIVDDRGEGTILNDDEDPGEIRIASAPAVDEGDGTAIVTVERTGNTFGPASVRIAASNGTARAGEDFQAVSETLQWADGESGGKSFELEILDDNVEEGNETVSVSLSDVSGAVLGEPSRLVITIRDDDEPSGLEGDTDTEIDAKVGEEIELEVRAVRADGVPVQGTNVVWEVVEGDAELLDGNSSQTDADGIAVKTVRLPAAPGTVRVTASLGPASSGALPAKAETTVTFTISVAGKLDELFDPNQSEAEASVAEVLNDGCRDPGESFGELCDYIFELEDPDDQRQVIEETTPRETVAQGDVSLDALRAQLGNVGRRLAALRGGATGQSVEQLAWILNGEPIPVAVLASAFSPFAGENRFLDSLDAAVESLAQDEAHSEAQDRGGDETAPAVDESLDTSVDGASRWGLFVNGRISIGDSPATVQEEGFELETLGVTAGLDYRLSDRSVVGGAVGFLDIDADLDSDGGSLAAEGYSLSAYTSYFADSFYFDAVLSFGDNDFDIVRNVDLPVPFQGQSRFSARAEPSGSQVAFSAGGGYDATVGGTGSGGVTTVGGFGRVSWIDADVDGYSETGAGPFNLGIRDQSVESLLVEIGTEISRPISKSWGVLQPTFRASALRELKDDSRLIRGRFLEAADAGEFAVPTDAPDRDYFNLGVGLTATFARGRSFFVFYDTDLEREDLDLYTLSVGLRFEL